MATPDPRFDAFELMKRGQPLAFTMARGRLFNHKVSLLGFAIDAKAAEWSRDQIERAIAFACEANRIPFRPEWLRECLALLWVRAGRLKPPGCWPEMKKRLHDAFEKAEREAQRKTQPDPEKN